MNYFGTDGIRGTYGSTLNDSTAFLLGKSLCYGQDCPIIIIARDTRVSGEKLFKALANGVYAGGGNVINLGILPTNAVGHFVRKLGGDYGVMISASHNPPSDNGLKVFDKYGVKLCQSKQQALSEIMDKLTVDDNIGNVITEPVFYDIENIYTNDILKQIDINLQGTNIALDCCYGASYRVAPLLFNKANAVVTPFCNRPLGDKINVDCGATHPEFLTEKLRNTHCRLAFSFDGDSDRLAVFENGQFVSNNRVFYAIAKYLKQIGKLSKNTVCGTTLTNGGVERALNNIGVKLLRSDVGDTNVFNMMVSNSLNFGGEESGHYLLCDYATSADALVNALFVAKIYFEVGSLLTYTEECVDLPYTMESIKLTDSTLKLASAQSLATISERLNTLYPDCRIVLRKSGTENKVRCYAEGQDNQLVVKEVVATFSQYDK